MSLAEQDYNEITNICRKDIYQIEETKERRVAQNESNAHRPKGDFNLKVWNDHLRGIT